MIDSSKRIRRAVCDIEADSLTPTVIWCVVLKDTSTGVVTALDDPTVMASELTSLVSQYDEIIFHNGIEYDVPAIAKVLGVLIPKQKVVDTLVLSRLLNAGRQGGHSLGNWGVMLKFPKGDWSDFSKYSEDMLKYCINDVHLNHKVYDELMKVVNRNGNAFKLAIECEMEMAWICRGMHVDGFKYDLKEADKIKEELEGRLEVLHGRIQASFPPRSVATDVITPRSTKSGALHKAQFKWYQGDDYTFFEAGSEFCLLEWQEFNPGSPKQVVDRLWEAGWKPTEKTKTHLQAEKDKRVTDDHKRYGWKSNETNLSSLPDGAPDGARCLVEYILLSARIRTLTEWKAAYNNTDGRVHGKFNSIGTRTHRMSHTNPNLGNVATAKTIKYNSPALRELAISYGGRMRSLWTCDDDSYLCGCDMEGAHLRIFAHLINDKDFIKALVSGKKEDGTDPHTLNMRKLGPSCPDRDRAKTFIFTFLNGGGASKVSEILSTSKKEAARTLDGFISSYPGLVRLRETVIPRDAARGYFIGIDGRYVLNDSEHHMIGMYLQNAEAVLMKHANIRWRAELDKLGVRYKQVNMVHDEFVTEVYGSKDDAIAVGKLQADAIRWVGEKFNLNCPLAGEYKVGKNWLDVH